MNCLQICPTRWITARILSTSRASTIFDSTRVNNIHWLVSQKITRIRHLSALFTESTVPAISSWPWAQRCQLAANHLPSAKFANTKLGEGWSLGMDHGTSSTAQVLTNCSKLVCIKLAWLFLTSFLVCKCLNTRRSVLFIGANCSHLLATYACS